MTKTRKQWAAEDPVQRLVQSCNKIIDLLHIYLADLDDPKEEAKLQKKIDGFSRDVALVAALPYTDKAAKKDGKNGIENDPTDD